MAILLSVLASLVLTAMAPQTPAQFGGEYSGLGSRRQDLVGDWVSRFNQVTGLKLEPGPFYDTYIKLSMKTTFDAVTHALMTTPLTDESGQPLGDALGIVERIDTVRGQSPGASGDRQFRIYVTLKESARATLERSREFKRWPDNTVCHKNYPINFRAQGGPPSIQVSVALDGRRADIDVDYRASSFPAALFNGHLTAANSDVRAGNNYDRHTARQGYGTYYGATFYVSGTRRPGAALLWAREKGYWKVVSWQINVDEGEPVHPAVHLLEHALAGTFTLVSYPDDIGDAAGCTTAVNPSDFKAQTALRYGKFFGMNVRFVTEAGEGPVMRTLWVKDATGWLITAYRVEYP